MSEDKGLVKEIEVVYVEIEKLNPAEYNPRNISEESLENLKLSIQHFGTVDPLIVRRQDNLVIGGHHWSEREAAKAYDIAAKKYFKEYALLNFPKTREAI